MTIYLIDYENSRSLTGIDNLSADDCVVIFYSENADKLSFTAHKEIIASKATVEYKRVAVGKTNALDFQLDTYLGYLINKYEGTDCKFYIVAKDKGYPFVAKFWKNEKAIDIKIVSDLTGGLTAKAADANSESAKPAAKKQQKASTTPPASTIKLKDEIINSLKASDLGLTDNKIKEVAEIVTKNTKEKDAMNSDLNRLLKDSTKTGEILKLINPLIKK